MYKPYETSFRNQSMTIREKLYNISFSYVMFIVILAAIGMSSKARKHLEAADKPYKEAEAIAEAVAA